MPQLHETIMGRKVFEHDLPSIAKNLSTIASALQEQNEIAVRTNLIAIETNELKKRELDLLEKLHNAGEVKSYEPGEILE